MKDLDNPQLSIVTKIFIVVGLVALAALSFVYYDQHKNDSELAHTAIDPDSALADHFDVKFDTATIDSAKARQREAEEKAAAEKVLVSIRQNAAEATATESTPEETSDETATPAEASEAPAATPEPTAPVVEAIE